LNQCGCHIEFVLPPEQIALLTIRKAPGKHYFLIFIFTNPGTNLIERTKRTGLLIRIALLIFTRYPTINQAKTPLIVQVKNFTFFISGV
jgi:hypothetical protein